MMDVNDIMQNLATVVNEQGDMLDNIEYVAALSLTTLPALPTPQCLYTYTCTCTLHCIT